MLGDDLLPDLVVLLDGHGDVSGRGDGTGRGSTGEVYIRSRLTLDLK